MSDNHSIFGAKKRSTFGASSGGSDVDEFAVDLNLTPLMDVMSNILFFLLAGFGAAILSFLAASVPVQSDSDAAPDAPRTDKVTVNLQIAAEGYKLSIANDRLPPDELAKGWSVLQKTAKGTYDNDALSATLLELKRKYPASDTVMIVPSDATVYEEIVAAMEASKDVKQAGQRLRLFPKAVIADLVKADTAEAPAAPAGGP